MVAQNPNWVGNYSLPPGKGWQAVTRPHTHTVGTSAHSTQYSVIQLQMSHFPSVPARPIRPPCEYLGRCLKSRCSSLAKSGFRNSQGTKECIQAILHDHSDLF